ncbi:hypothetical protein [Candidatus Williamhamiltonella defendens]|uniref:hypothetical protein n=1 Tax=Candidatus Williamhamiltonella defendens TaxID=138072 RepID=UPI00130E53A8|nr:hypothetical protein [Candidatus Hamiltonella defensa]
MKAPMGRDAESDLVHIRCSGSEPRFMWRSSPSLTIFIFHGEEEFVHGDAGDKGVMRCRIQTPSPMDTWHIIRRSDTGPPNEAATGR